jgi:co-chaperonin GroES (HSP10)
MCDTKRTYQDYTRESFRLLARFIKGGLMKATRGKVIIKRDELEEKVGEIYIPDVAQKKPCIGTVVSVGEGDLQRDLKEGDRIYFDGAVDKFEYDGCWYHTLKYSDVAGIVE